MESYDTLQVYCPKLGHVVPFRYCRSVKDGLPCGQSIHCWQEQMDIREYIAGNYTGEEVSRIFAPPKDKIETIVDLIEKSKKSL